MYNQGCITQFYAGSRPTNKLLNGSKSFGEVSEHGGTDVLSFLKLFAAQLQKALPADLQPCSCCALWSPRLPAAMKMGCSLTSLGPWLDTLWNLAPYIKTPFSLCRFLRSQQVWEKAQYSNKSKHSRKTPVAVATVLYLFLGQQMG